MGNDDSGRMEGEGGGGITTVFELDVGEFITREFGGDEPLKFGGESCDAAGDERRPA